MRAIRVAEEATERSRPPPSTSKYIKYWIWPGNGNGGAEVMILKFQGQKIGAGVRPTPLPWHVNCSQAVDVFETRPGGKMVLETDFGKAVAEQTAYEEVARLSWPLSRPRYRKTVRVSAARFAIQFTAAVISNTKSWARKSYRAASGNIRRP
ncbi:hypothetical protein EJ04DRAFT_122531 [Polyplosphaeria fusca]|uniref:Uncharacterized protein n=1 Tax=Polyplosphaeria fusca TaxID=682080 RepID=A0A9P4QK70_9PLEO|nr:hypothetical protein EJ04DRAFT_122531 [Polyplosphaeria fusca]